MVYNLPIEKSKQTKHTRRSKTGRIFAAGHGDKFMTKQHGVIVNNAASTGGKEYIIINPDKADKNGFEMLDPDIYSTIKEAKKAAYKRDIFLEKEL